MKLLPVKPVNGKQSVEDYPNFSGRVGLAVPPGFRLVSAELVRDPRFLGYEVEVAPQYWNPRYWLHRWRMRRAIVVELEA